MEKETIGNAELYCGDCAVILPQIEPVDLILTDPPYGIAYDSSHKKYKNGVTRDKCEWDIEPFDPRHILAMDSNIVIWGGNCFSSKLPDKTGWLSWVKIDRNGTKRRQAETEMAWTNCINRSQAFRWNWIGAGMEGEGNAVYGGLQHPTQKPIALMEWCMTITPKFTTVLDPYMGSGTTGVAAMNLEKRFIGIERERRYFDIACERIDRAQAQGRLAI